MKKLNSGYFAIAFVWFSSHFGGGFASGRQLIDFYLAHQWTSIFMPALSMMIMALSLYFSMVIATKYRAFDYSEWSNRLYGKTGFVMAPVYEILFNATMVLATAVAFATGGSTLTKSLGTPYLFNTIAIAAVIFVLTIYGATLVQKAATLVSLVLIACIFVIYLPNIIYFFPNILENIAALKSGEIVTGADSSFLSTIWWGIKYGTLQSVAIGAYVVHSQVCANKSCLKKAAITGFIINTGIMYLSYLGILAFVDKGVMKEAVPSLFVVMNGVGGVWMTALISLCIVIGAVSTGVALVYGTTNRLANFFGRNLEEAERRQRRQMHSIIASTILVVICWLVAQLGLIPLIGKGYGHLGWIALLIITLPIILRGTGVWPLERAKTLERS